MQLIISASPKKITRILGLVVLFLILASSAGLFSQYVLGYGRLLGLIPLFNFDREQSIATWYSSVMLLFCSILLAAIAFAKKTAGKHYVVHWSVLSFIFLYLSIDEAVSIHELSVEPMRSTLNASGFLYYTWVVLGAAFVLILLLAYWRFLLALPAKTRNLFLLAGTIYIGGVIGMELIGGYYYSPDLVTQSLPYAFAAMVEESLEMMGIVLFIYALLSYMKSHVVKQVVICLGNETSQDLLIGSNSH